MPKRIIVDENGLVVAVESIPERTTAPSPKGNSTRKARAKKGYKGRPESRWKEPSSGPAAARESSTSSLAQRILEKRRRENEQLEAVRARDAAPARRRAEKRPREKELEAEVARDAAPARRRAEQDFRVVDKLTSFEAAYAIGLAASRASSPNYPLAIAAFSKAYRLDPRRKVKPGRKPDPGLFEVPTRLAAAYRLNGQSYEAQKMYEWVLQHHDNRFARVGLAAVHEDAGKHVMALRLYESVLADEPHNRYALYGIAKTLANLGRHKEAREAYEKARRASSN